MQAAKGVHWYRIAIHLLLIILASLVVVLAQQNRDLRQNTSQGMAPTPGTTVRSFAAQNLNGESQMIDLADSHRTSLLLVFTTTCPACQQNQDHWRTIYEKSNEQYSILGVSLSDLDSTITYRETYQLPFRTLVAEAPKDFASSIQISEIPFTVLVDRDGIVQGSWRGILSKKSILQLVGS